MTDKSNPLAVCSEREAFDCGFFLGEMCGGKVLDQSENPYLEDGPLLAKAFADGWEDGRSWWLEKQED